MILININGGVANARYIEAFESSGHGDGVYLLHMTSGKTLRTAPGLNSTEILDLMYAAREEEIQVMMNTGSAA